MSTSVRALAEAALEIGRQRAVLEHRIRAALQRGDEAKALRLTRVLVGLEPLEVEDAEGDRAPAREH